MSNEAYQIIAIIIYMAVMLYIGWYSFKRTGNLTDYMLGGRGLGPAVTALSAGASDMSGWLLMGLPGAIYVSGLADAWIAIGLTTGAYLNWLFVAPRLRVYTQVSNESITIPGFLENRLKDNTMLLRIISGIVILIFFTFYVSSGMVAGAVFFESSFGLNYYTGLLIVSAVVVTYTLFGGFLAVSYTDFVQGLMMLTALIFVPILGFSLTGGVSETFDTVRTVDPNLLSFFSGTTVLGIISAAAWGLGYFGQPHIIVRFMAIKSVSETKKARRIGMSWMILSLIGTSLTALIGLAHFTQQGLEIGNPETVFIVLGQILFHPFVAGFILAAILAAIMSTISSQLIVTSSALTEDLYRTLLRKEGTDKEYVFFGRMAVLGVAIVAGILAMDRTSSILDLVGYAWAGFGGAFGPIILLSLYWKKLTNWGAIVGMVGGATTVILWNTLTDAGVIPFSLYEIVPGFLVNLILAIVVSLLTYKPNQEIEDEFDESVRLLKELRG